MKVLKILREAIDLNRYFSSENTFARRITFYAESAFYYRYFSGYIDYILKNSSHDLCYITSEADDPIFRDDNKRIKKFYAASFFPYISKRIDARALVYTMDDLHQFAVKRSLHPETEHIFTFHGPYSTTMAHREGAFDYYDTIFCIGPYQKEEILKREQKHSLPHKKIVEVGYPYLDDIVQQQKSANCPTKRETVLIAPSWHEGNIFESCIIPLGHSLLMSGFKIIVRPHDETLRRNPNSISVLREHFKQEENIYFDLEMRSSKSLQLPALLVTDWSGIAFEWAIVRENPILFVNARPKIHNKNYMDLGLVPMEIQAREHLGKSIAPEDMENAGKYAWELLEERNTYVRKIRDFRKSMIYNFGNSAEIGAQYILSLL